MKSKINDKINEKIIIKIFNYVVHLTKKNTT